MNEYFEHIRKWQTVYAIIFAITVQFILYGSRLNTLEARVDKVEVIQDSNQVLLVDIQKDIVEVKTSLEFIKQRLND